MKLLIAVLCTISSIAWSSGEEEKLLEYVEKMAPWDDDEPNPLPDGWKKHTAEKELIISYGGGEIHIPNGDTYFTFQDKIAIGWHGTYNPPSGM